MLIYSTMSHPLLSEIKTPLRQVGKGESVSLLEVVNHALYRETDISCSDLDESE